MDFFFREAVSLGMAEFVREVSAGLDSLVVGAVDDTGRVLRVCVCSFAISFELEVMSWFHV